MKFTANASALASALSRVSLAVERRATIPILSNVLITARGGKVKLATTDLDIWISEEIEAYDTEDGAFTVECATLKKIATRLPKSSDITFESDAERATVKSGLFFESLLVGIPSEDFPHFPMSEFPYQFDLSAQALNGVLSRVAHAISTEETRYYLNGVFFERLSVDGTNAIRVVATDGHRLALANTAAACSDFPSSIVPRKAIKILLTVLPKLLGNVTIQTTRRNGEKPALEAMERAGTNDAPLRQFVQFKCGSLTITTKPIDGTFPNYGRIIPNDNLNVLRVRRDDLAEAVRCASAVLAEKHSPVKFTLSLDGVSVSAAAPDTGTALKRLNGSTSYDGVPLEIGFQARYLNDAVKGSGPDLELRFLDGSSPAILSDAGKSDVLEILMPMRV